MPTPGTGAGAGFDTPLPAGGATVDGTTGNTIDPTIVAAANDPSVLAADQAVSTANAIASQAQTEYEAAAAAFNQIVANPNAMFDTTGAVKAASDRVDKAQQALVTANSKLVDAQTKVSDAATSAAARVASSRNQTPGLGDYYTQHAALASAQAELTKAQTSALNAKTPADIAQVQAQTADATAHAQSLGILTPAQANAANAQAAQSAAQASQITTLTPLLAQKTAAEAANTQAQTGTLIPSQATLNQAQADEAKARVGLDDAQASEIVGKTPAEIDNLVAQGKLTQSQADLVKAEIPGQQATTAKTVAETEQLKLGGLYGVQDRITAMRDAIARGDVTPDHASDQLNQYIQSQVQQASTGATQFQRNQAALDAETARRQQDTGLAGSEMSSYGSALSSGANTFAKLNDTAPVGSNAVGLGWIAYQRSLQDALNSMKPSTPAETPLLQSMRAPAGPPTSTPTPPPMPMPAPSAAPAPAAPVAPRTTIAPDGTVTVEHTPAAPTPPSSGPSPDWLMNSPASPMQNPASMPQFLAQRNPAATPNDVMALWAGDPHFDPTAQGSATAGAGAM